MRTETNSPNATEEGSLDKSSQRDPNASVDGNSIEETNSVKPPEANKEDTASSSGKSAGEEEKRERFSRCAQKNPRSD